MKDFLGQEINVGDWVIAKYYSSASEGYFSKDFYFLGPILHIFGKSPIVLCSSSLGDKKDVDRIYLSEMKLPTNIKLQYGFFRPDCENTIKLNNKICQTAKQVEKYCWDMAADYNGILDIII